MPLAGSRHTSYVAGDEPAYFECLLDLDKHLAKSAGKLWDAVLPYASAAAIHRTPDRGKLLMCHDYKGGYTESPETLSYTFNFWNLCDVFVYFSHHCVTAPPPGWSTAAHRQGVKMLGTLIFEGSAEEDCLRLVIGPIPTAQTGPAAPPTHPAPGLTIPVSNHYARALAELARARRFDGYLLNFECPLRGGPEQARALSTWVGLLRDELHATIGPHAEVIWYDSVIITGQLRWQDRLNSLNLPFFLPSTGFFTNYTWPPFYPNLTAQYFLSLVDSQSTESASWQSNMKTLAEIYIGVDVWGRGSHGGGGFGSYRALSHISPRELGLGAAIFGHAWTWETQQDEAGWTWAQWWARERRLYVGPVEEGDVPPMPQRHHPDEPECSHGPFEPISSFFDARSAPDPRVIPFYTSFCPGVGRAWFVRGRPVFHSTHHPQGKDWEHGWTDVAHQTVLGSLLWPDPVVSWEHDMRTETIPPASAELIFHDAWIGGSALRLTLSVQGSDAEDAFFRCVWIPIQALACTPDTSYTFKTWYKLEDTSTADLDVGISVKPLSTAGSNIIEITSATNTHELEHGWHTLTVNYKFLSGREKSDGSTDVAIGLVIGIAMDDPTQSAHVSILLGQITVGLTSDTDGDHPTPRITWASLRREDTNNANGANNAYIGTLIWGVANAFQPLQQIQITSPDDPRPAWPTAQAQRCSQFFSFNIFAHGYTPGTGACGPADTAKFIGSTGLDGQSNRFVVEKTMLSCESPGAPVIRFFIQGLTISGEILPWENCAYVDVERV